MKTALFILLFFLSLHNVNAQVWITDNNFEQKISSTSAFEDSDNIVVVEFYANFNKENSFKDWKKLNGVTYYRCDIANSPLSKKKYRVRMAPTLIVFDKEGYQFKVFKAGLDLLCPVKLPELQEAIEQSKKESKF